MKRRVGILLTLFFFYFLPNIPGFIHNTLITTSQLSTPISQLNLGTELNGYNTCEHELVSSKIIAKNNSASSTIVALHIHNEIIVATPEQLFWNPTHNTWIQAQHITPHTTLLNNRNQHVHCSAVYKQHSLIRMWDLTVEYPHTFFVGHSKLLVHNFLPIALSATYFFGGGLSYGITLGLGILGLGIKWHHDTNKEKKSKFNLIPVTQPTNSIPPNPNNDDDDDKNASKVDNKNEFFEKTILGSNITDKVEKTNKQAQGQSIYRVTKKAQEYGLRKGDLLYLDNKHKNHIEVFNKTGEFKQVLNLDGSYNEMKTKRGFYRSL